MKYIFITGGVVSSLGKGIAASAIGLLLESRAIKVTLMKFDPYLNVDAGTMNPFQHGEVYVTDDGAETDLDLGHYYRYTRSPLSRLSNATSGQIYHQVIKKERKGDYLGKTVQVIPHITDEIQQRILAASRQDPETKVTIVEVGGTVGDIESLPFLEAIRQFCGTYPSDCINLHLTYVPYLKAAGEVKTKPTQHSVQTMRAIGIVPDFILCRCETSLSQEIKSKISLFCSVPTAAVIDVKDVSQSVYEVPLELHEQHLDEMICKRLDLSSKPAHLTQWKEMLARLLHPKKKVIVGIVGKYMDHNDAYKSVLEALRHAATGIEVSLEIRRFESALLMEDKESVHALKECNGFVVPGGFGERGWDGKLFIAEYCRTQKIPYFGLCLGMQVMIVEFARNVLKLPKAHSTEVDPSTQDAVISLLSEQRGVHDLGGTMRLGAYSCKIAPSSLAMAAYQQSLISERHRHRFEFNNQYKERFENGGMRFSGILDGGSLCEISEIQDHPWMLGVQFHPEFKSKPLQPHPLFAHFLKELIKNR